MNEFRIINPILNNVAIFEPKTRRKLNYVKFDE